LVRSKASQLAPHFAGPLRYAKPKELTGRQSDVLRLLLNGFSNKEIARELNVSPHTVKIHVGALLRHFAVERRTDLPVATSRSHRNGTHPTSFSQPEDTPRASLLIDAE
jgi:DNA-binding NarL/FixJ family response regulator